MVALTSRPSGRTRHRRPEPSRAGRAQPTHEEAILNSILIVDGANVAGSRPDGWWKDRAGAASRLHQRLLVADTSYDEIVLVLEGKAKAGVRAGVDQHVRVVHAPRDGDSAIVAEVGSCVNRGQRVVVITADRVLATVAENLGARTMSPGWLLDQIG